MLPRSHRRAIAIEAVGLTAAFITMKVTHQFGIMFKWPTGLLDGNLLANVVWAIPAIHAWIIHRETQKEQHRQNMKSHDANKVELGKLRRALERLGAVVEPEQTEHIG